LVTGDSDLTVPKEALTHQETSLLIHSPFLIRWFAQNTQVQKSDKIVQIPIGLDYHTISNNPSHNWRMPHEGNRPGQQEQILLNIKRGSISLSERLPKIYVNFSKGNDRFGQRKDAINTIPCELLVTNETFIRRTQTWNNIIKYAFVLSPFGNGMDCHRTWETLCLGSIPILKAPNFRSLFEDLPVLIVDEWSEITQALLDKTLFDFSNKEFNMNKLSLRYWTDKIHR
jgi:hypothetical protein